MRMPSFTSGSKAVHNALNPQTATSRIENFAVKYFSANIEALTIGRNRPRKNTYGLITVQFNRKLTANAPNRIQGDESHRSQRGGRASCWPMAIQMSERSSPAG